MNSPAKSIPQPASSTVPSAHRATYLALLVVIALGTLDQSIVATALPRIMGELGGLSVSAWVVTAYVLSSTAVMPLYGKLGDQYGRKPMIAIAVLCFLLGSLLCGLAGDVQALIAARVVQGLGAGAFIPLSQAIIADLIPPTQRGKKQGGVAAVYALTSIAGPIAGGLITEALSWHWIFFVNLPIGAVALYVLMARLQNRRPSGSQRIDYLGAALLSAAVTAWLLVLSLGGGHWAWRSPPLLALASVGLLLSLALLLHLQRCAEPILPPALFTHRVFNISSLVMAMTFMGLFGASIFLPMYSQLVAGDSSTVSGLMMVPLMLGAVLGSLLSGRLMARTARYKPAQLCGLTMAFLAFSALTWAVASAQSAWVIEPIVFVLGTGLGLVMPNTTVAVQNALPWSLRGVGTAMLTFFRSMGGLVGVAASSAVIAVQVDTALAAGAPVSDAYRSAIAETFGVGALVIGLALLALLRLPELPLRDGDETPAVPPAGARHA